MMIKAQQQSVLVLVDENGEIAGAVITIPGKGHIFFSVEKMGIEEISRLFDSGLQIK